MSGSVTPNTSAPSGTSGSSGTGSSGGSDPLGSLTSNFSSFLQMLMTQLQNQDPTSPMDTNQFTTELVQFSSVEQQINTNNSLKQLIQLTQGGEVVQSTGMLGHTVTAQSNQLALQNGSAAVQFTLPTAGRVGAVVSNSSGNQLFATTLNASAGANTWTWNGQNGAGTALPDGGYNVVLTQENPDGSSAALPFTISGKATGVLSQGQSVQLELGSVPIDFADIRSVSN